MCTLALFHRPGGARPVVLAANRDEFYARPTAGPGLLATEPWIVGGRDIVAGGTWLGLNADGLVAGLLNRRTANAIDPTRRSRGQLCLDALRHNSVLSAATFVCAQRADHYNPFNLLLASPAAACVIGNISGAMVRQDLTPGVHLLTNLEINDFECPRIAKSYGLFSALAPAIDASDPETLCAALRAVLADHSTPLDPRAHAPLNNLCVHTEMYGTRSATIVLAQASPTVQWHMWYAPGPPCLHEPRAVALPPQLQNSR